MATSFGIGQAAGAFAQNYAAALGLRSRLDSEAQQQEMNTIKLQREREFDAAQKEMAKLHTDFLNPEFDLTNNRPYEQPQGGIADPSKPKPPSNPYADTERMNAYYDRMTPLLEKQAMAAGKGNEVLSIRKNVEELRKSRYMERLGESLARIESGDAGGFEQLKGVYNMYPDGNKLKSGQFNDDGTITVTWVNKDGEEKQQVTTFDKLSNLAKSAMSLADTVKLRHAEIEAKKEREFKGDQNDKDRAVKTSEGAADRASREKISGNEITARKEISSNEIGARVSMNNADIASREGIVDKQIKAEAPRREAQVSENRTQNEARQQQFFDNYFQVDSKFAPKPESELKNMFGDAKKAYERDLDRWSSSTKLSRAAKTFSALNPEVPMANIANITRQLEKGQMDVNQESGGDKRRFVTYQGKRVYLD